MKIGTLFSGFEGVGIGARAAGLDLAWGVELDPAIAAVANDNLGDHVIAADVLTVDPASLPPVDVLHASPPCIRASSANATAELNEDGTKETELDKELARKVAEFVRVLRPRFFTLENVYAYRKFKSWLEILEPALNECGYWSDLQHVNFADLGVPQTRKRMIVRAVRGGFVPPLPAAVPWVSWYTAIADLIDSLPDSTLAPWQIKKLPEDIKTLIIGNHSHTVSGARVWVGANEPMMTVSPQYLGRSRAVLVAGDSNENSWGDNYRNEDQPAFTAKANAIERSRIVAAPVLIGSDNARGCDNLPTIRSVDQPAITVRASRVTKHLAIDGGRVVAMTARALARFQSFPDSFVLPDDRKLAATGIGNAVPPLGYQRIIESLIDQ